MLSHSHGDAIDPAHFPLLVSLDQTKAYLGIAHMGEDSLITELLGAAIQRVEQISGCALIERGFETRWRTWPLSLTRGGVALPFAPVRGLNSVSIHQDGTYDTDLTHSFYICGGGVCLTDNAELPALEGGQDIRLTYVAGLVAPVQDEASIALPADLRQAILSLCKHSYTLRSMGACTESAPVPSDVLAILQARRGVRL